MIYDSVNYIYTNQHSLVSLVCVETIIVKVTKVQCQGKNNETSLRHFDVSTQPNEISEYWFV